MTSHLFPTYEIGSLAKPPWLRNALRNAPHSASDLEWVKKWATDIKITNVDQLVAALERPQDAHRQTFRDWAALFSIRFLESAGLDYVYDGEARRAEMYEYPIRHIEGFEFRGTVRSFDNRYYLKAACVGPLELAKPYHVEEFKFVREHANAEIKVPITGPYTLADWSFNEYHQRRLESRISEKPRLKAEGKRELVLELAKEVIRPNLKALEEGGAEWIQFDEPAVTTHPEEVPLFVEAFNTSAEGIDCKLSVHICYGDYSRLFPHVSEMKKCDHFALEFANRDDDKRSGYRQLELFREYDNDSEIGLGVVDIHANSVEPPELIRDRILYASERIGNPRRIFVNPDCGLRTRTWDVARSKLVNLVKGAELARQALD